MIWVIQMVSVNKSSCCKQLCYVLQGLFPNHACLCRVNNYARTLCNRTRFSFPGQFINYLDQNIYGRVVKCSFLSPPHTILSASVRYGVQGSSFWRKTMGTLKCTEVWEPLLEEMGTTIILIVSHFQLPSLSHHTQPGPEMRQLFMRQRFGSGSSSFCSLVLYSV